MSEEELVLLALELTRVALNECYPYKVQSIEQMGDRPKRKAAVKAVYGVLKDRLSKGSDNKCLMCGKFAELKYKGALYCSSICVSDSRGLK